MDLVCEELGEPVSLTTAGNTYTVYAVVTNYIMATDDNSTNRTEATSRKFRLTLPDDVLKINYNDKITYDGLEYAIISVETGYGNNIKCLAIRDTVKEIGKDRRSNR